MKREVPLHISFFKATFFYHQAKDKIKAKDKEVDNN